MLSNSFRSLRHRRRTHKSHRRPTRFHYVATTWKSGKILSGDRESKIQTNPEKGCDQKESAVSLDLIYGSSTCIYKTDMTNSLTAAHLASRYVCSSRHSPISLSSSLDRCIHHLWNFKEKKRIMNEVKKCEFALRRNNK